PSVPHGTLALAEACSPSTLEHLLRSDMAAIRAVRKRNYALLLERLASVDGIEILYPSIGELVPHNFPLRIKDGLREKLYFALMDRGIPTIALYYRMIDGITAEAHPNSH